MSYFVLYRPVFMLELLAAEFLFTLKLRKRSYFVLRYILSAVSCVAFAAFVPLKPEGAVSLSVVFLVYFVLTFALHVLCYDAPIPNILFCLTVAYVIQHFAYCVSNGVLLVTGLNDDVYGIYTEQATAEIFTARNVFGAIFTFAIYYISYYLFFLFLGGKMRKNERLHLRNSSLLVLSAVAISLSIFVNSMAAYGGMGNGFITAFNMYNALSCCFIIYMLFGMMRSVRTEDELNAVNKILKEYREQYEASKKNIELINIKCHDLKHQIRRLGQANNINETAISEIADAISIYDSEVETGNKALDTILTEKSLYCYKNNISLTCMADGSLLNFMNEAELYSMFGNAVDNAISAVRKIADTDKHTIGLNVSQVKDFVTVNINNYYEGELDYTAGGGLPSTTKKDKENHGYGLKSIIYIAEKYGGKVSVKASGGVFDLNIIFPIKRADA